MGRLILAIIAFAMAIAVLKMVIVALVLAGLIFRTKQTLGLLLLGGTLSLIAAYPPTLFIIAGLFILAAIIKAVKDKKPDAPPALEDHSQG